MSAPERQHQNMLLRNFIFYLLYFQFLGSIYNICLLKSLNLALMAICYSRTFLKAVLTSSSNSRVSSELWRYFIQLGINKGRPTRRGCRSGRQIANNTLGSSAPSLNILSTSQYTDFFRFFKKSKKFKKQEIICIMLQSTY